MRKSFILVAMVCSLGLALFFSLRGPHGDPAGGPQGATQVRVLSLSLQDVPRTLSGIGTVQALHGASGTTPMAVEFALPRSVLPVLENLIQNTENPPVLAYAATDRPSPPLLAEGRLTLLDSEDATATGTLRLKAEFENTQRTLQAGQAVDLQVQTDVLRQVLAVPAKVVQRGIEQAFVYRLADDRVAAVPVKVVYRTAMLDVIEGVQEGDILVIDAPARLQAGTRVHVVTP